ncbi:DNA-binding protein snt1 [Cryptotrichosporon argae]
MSDFPRQLPPHLPLKPATPQEPWDARIREREGREARGDGREEPARDGRGFGRESRWAPPPPPLLPRSRGPNSFRPHARTPSPPRSYDREREWERERERERDWERDRERGDVRDRLSLDVGRRFGPGSGAPPDRRPPFRDDDRRIAERWDDRDRFRDRDERGAPSRPPPLPRFDRPQLSPPSSRRPPAPSPGYKPASFARRDSRERERPSGPSTSTSMSGAPGRALPGPGPSTAAARAASPPRAPRSMRGSSSPAESKRPAPDADDKDLEEGEIVSPVRKASWGDDRYRRDRWGWGPKRSVSPSPAERRMPLDRRPSLDRKPPFEETASSRPLSPPMVRGYEQSTQGMASGQKVVASPSPARSPRPSSEAISSMASSTAATAQAPQADEDTLRPPTPPLPESIRDFDVDTAPTDSASNETAIVAATEQVVAPLEQAAAETSANELPVPSIPTPTPARSDIPPVSKDPEAPEPVALETPVEPTSSSEVVQIDAEAADAPTADSAATEEVMMASPVILVVSAQAEEVNAVVDALDSTGDGLTSPAVPTSTSGAAPASTGQTNLQQDTTTTIVAPLIEGRTPDVRIAIEIAMVNSPEAPAPELTSPQGLQSQPLRVSPSRPTIAQRRSVQLPPTSASLSPPFGSRLDQRDPMPTADSMPGSTDAETEVESRFAERDDDETQSEASEGALEAAREANLIAAVKAAQDARDIDVDAVLRWNHDAAPTPSTRIPGTDTSPELVVRTVCWEMEDAEKQVAIARFVSLTVAREKAALDARVALLREEYRTLDEEWQVHCAALDKSMEKRGPPPADLYVIPHAWIPAATPGPAPVTPVVEEALLGARANRRRGAGDAVATEAEFEAILAGLADTAAKDPNFRASKTAAVVPDMLPPAERRLAYDDDNDLVLDPLAFYDAAGKAEPTWTAEERATFVKRYLNFPKMFGRIADGLSDKTAAECVAYYYRTKKQVDYKGMLASRRGVKAKKAVPLKKGGRSGALLADLDRQKPTISAGDKGRERDSGTATVHKSRDGPASRRARVLRAGSVVPSTPGEKRDDDDSTTPSRAGSEVGGAGANGNRSKLRMTVKGKRPRTSSAAAPKDKDAVAEPPAAAAANTPANGDDAKPPLPASIPADGSAPLEPVMETELLPAIRRQKRRKVEGGAGGLDGVDSEGGTPGATAGAGGAGAAGTLGGGSKRRSATNSYWSVAEKNLFTSLVAKHGTDFKAIADDMGMSKTVQQVKNFYVAGEKKAGVPGTVSGGAGPGAPAGATQVKVSITTEYPYAQRYEYPPGARPEYRFAEPRMAVFPTTQGTLPPTVPTMPSASSSHASALATHAHAHAHGHVHQPLPAPTAKPPSPIAVSRPGSMRISALLNDDPPAPAPALAPATTTSAPPERERERAFDTASVASDGTVDERELDPPARAGAATALPSMREFERDHARAPPAAAASAGGAGAQAESRYAAATGQTHKAYSYASTWSKPSPTYYHRPAPTVHRSWEHAQQQQPPPPPPARPAQPPHDQTHPHPQDQHLAVPHPPHLPHAHTQPPTYARQEWRYPPPAGVGHPPARAHTTPPSESRTLPPLIPGPRSHEPTPGL